MNLTDDQKKIGQQNFQAAADGLTRRDFLLAGAMSVAVPAAGMGAFYFGYQRVNNPVKVGIIGTGDEGGVLIHNLNPEFLEVKAICDLRPYNRHRAFHGQVGREDVRQGLMNVYGWQSEDTAKKNVAEYVDYEEMLRQEKDLEAVIIAVPLSQHAKIAIAALKAGKHVLTEKLMAKPIYACKEMARLAAANDLLLATGHQRHYNKLYEQAKQMIRLGLIGDIHHIRAQWHRGNMPGMKSNGFESKDSWKPIVPDSDTVGMIQKELVSLRKKRDDPRNRKKFDAYSNRIQYLEQILLDGVLASGEGEKLIRNAGYAGFQSDKLEPSKVSPIEELIRWRLWGSTGGGLMAELGSHQLDAASIFISATREDGKKVAPLSVTGVGGRHLFPADRECDDHVYCTYEFPGQESYETLPQPEGYSQNKDRKIVVTYSSINGNPFGDWGEVVMGTEGTLVLEKEQSSMLFGKKKSDYMKVSVDENSGAMAMAASDSGWGGGSSGGGGGGTVGGGGGSWEPVSRGYKEEMEHWAWCIRNRAPENTPRCTPDVAMADAIIALTANIAMEQGKKIEFHPDWFDITSDRTPEGDLLGEKPTPLV